MSTSWAGFEASRGQSKTAITVFTSQNSDSWSWESALSVGSLVIQQTVQIHSHPARAFGDHRRYFHPIGISLRRHTGTGLLSWLQGSVLRLASYFNTVLSAVLTTDRLVERASHDPPKCIQPHFASVHSVQHFLTRLSWWGYYPRDNIQFDRRKRLHLTKPIRTDIMSALYGPSKRQGFAAPYNLDFFGRKIGAGRLERYLFVREIKNDRSWFGRPALCYFCRTIGKADSDHPESARNLRKS